MKRARKISIEKLKVNGVVALRSLNGVKHHITVTVPGG